MEAGRIVEQGTHATLHQVGGAYAALYDAQFVAAVVAGDSPDDLALAVILLRP